MRYVRQLTDGGRAWRAGRFTTARAVAAFAMGVVGVGVGVAALSPLAAAQVWDQSPGTPGLNEEAYAMTTWDDDGSGPNAPRLVAGGLFSTAGGGAAQLVARWNGTSWASIGTGITFNHTVNAIAVFDEDGAGPAPASLFAAGQFTSITQGGSTTTINHIARWNGSAWVDVGPVGVGVNGFVPVLYVSSVGGTPALYVGGLFGSAGGVATTGIAKWSGSAWSALGAGTNFGCYSMTDFNDGTGNKLYVGGLFTTAGGSPASRIARWNGSAWSALGSGLNNNCWALTTHNDGSGTALYAGGAFTAAGGAAASRVAKWNGTAWSNLSGPAGQGTDQQVFALASYDLGNSRALYAGGDLTMAGGVSASRAAVWQCGAWSPLAGGFNGRVYAISPVGSIEPNLTGLFYCGAFTQNNGLTANRVARLVSNDSPCAPPSNDNCSSARMVGEGQHAFSLVGATNDGSAPCGSSADSADVWFAFTAPSSGRLRVQTCGRATFDTVLSIQEGCGGPVIVCNNDTCGSQSVAEAEITAGSSYRIRVAGFGGAIGTGGIDVALVPNCYVCNVGDNPVIENEPPCTQINGGCATTPNAFAALGDDCPVCGTLWANVGANNDSDWYKLHVPALGSVTINIEVDSSFGALAALYSGTCPTPTLAAPIWDIRCFPGTSSNTFMLAAGTYFLKLYPGSLANGPYDGASGCEFYLNYHISTTGLATCGEPPPPPINPDCCPVPDETIVLRSGQSGGFPGNPGAPDDVIRAFATGPANQCMAGSLFDPSTGSLPFASCGAPAEVIAPYSPPWTTGLQCDRYARWINWNAGFNNYGIAPKSTLYCHPFNINSQQILSACLTFCWKVDDYLGDPTPNPLPGVYINGFALSPSILGGNYATDTTVTVAIPPNFLNPGGSNTLYIYQRDGGCAVSGIIYSAQINICRPPFDDVCACCPKPSEILVLRSGQSNNAPGSPGALDDSVHYTSPPGNGCVPTSLYNASTGGLPFAAACAGPAAEVIAPHPAWTQTLNCDPRSRWINWNEDPSTLQGRPAHSALYCHPFTVKTADVGPACITICWAVDDYLGDPSGPGMVGVYLNGCPLTPYSGGAYSVSTKRTYCIPAGCLRSGLNNLYLYQRDGGCVVSGIIYTAQISICPATCVKPPSCMKLWVPMDERPNATVAADIAPGGVSGTYNNTGYLGGQYVANSRFFNGNNSFVQMPHRAALNPGLGDYAIDAWVKLEGPVTQNRTIVSKFGPLGYIWNLGAGGFQHLQMCDFSICTLNISPSPVPADNQWHHLAVVACQAPGGGRTVQFYLDGVPDGPALSSGVGTLNNANNFLIGSTSPAPSDVFLGWIDEVEFFCCCLNRQQIADLYNAKKCGKCKISIKAPWDFTIPVGANSVLANTCITNAGPGPVTVSLAAVFSHMSGGCPSTPVPGMTYSFPGGNIITVPVGKTCFDVLITVPAGTPQQTSCFTVSVTPLGTGCGVSSEGFLQVHSPVNVVVNNNNIDMAIGTATAARFTVTNLTSAATSLNFQIRARPSDMMDGFAPICFNNLNMDADLTGVLNLPSLIAVDFDFFIRLYQHCGERRMPADVVFSLDMNRNGTFEAQEQFSSISITEPPEADQPNLCPPCAADYNQDGGVDGADVSDFFNDWENAGPCADVNQDGGVDGADIGFFFPLWENGGCPPPCNQSPDFNDDGAVNGQDCAAFHLAFDGGSTTADFNCDGFVNPDDLGDFITAYTAATGQPCQ